MRSVVQLKTGRNTLQTPKPANSRIKLRSQQSKSHLVAGPAQSHQIKEVMESEVRHRPEAQRRKNVRYC